jgi:hypothetical protein
MSIANPLSLRDLMSSTLGCGETDSFSEILMIDMAGSEVR